MRFILQSVFIGICSVLLLSPIVIHAQGNEPWAAGSICGWSGNNNAAQYRYWEYFPSTAGYNHNGSLAQPTASSTGITFPSGQFGACDGSLGGRDIWFKIPATGVATTVYVITTLYNYDNADGIPMRMVIYKSTSCTGSGACTMNFVTARCSTVTNARSCPVFGGSAQFTDAVAVTASEDIYVRVWADDNDPDAGASVYALQGSSTMSAPVNDACSGGTTITSSALNYAGNNFNANGGDFRDLSSYATTCGWNLTENSVFYTFTPTANNVTITISDIACFFPACTGVPSADLQIAVYQAPSPISGCTNSATMAPLYRPLCSNNIGTINHTVSGLTSGVLHILALDGLSTKRCSWNGIGLTNIVLPVSWGAVEGFRSGSENRIAWSFGQTSGGGKFVVERSDDGIEWFETGILALNESNHEGAIWYTYTDVNAPAHKAYYRIQYIDIGGQSDISNTIEISPATEHSFVSSVFPSPASNHIQAVVECISGGTYLIEVSDLMGRTVYTDQGFWESGVNHLNIDVASLTSGIYFLTVTAPDGRRNSKRFTRE